MRDITKEYVLQLVERGIKKYGSQAEYERATGLNKQAIKDIRRAKKCPPADIWQKIAREANLENQDNKDSTQQNGLLIGMEILIAALLEREIIPQDDLELRLNRQLRDFRARNQLDEALVIDRLLDALHSKSSESAPVPAAQSQPPQQAQSLQEKTAKP